MAEITGATVTFTDYTVPATPRTLNIPDAWGDANAQDIWDTLSAEAAKIENLVYKKLLNRPAGGGKAVLSATKQVGITVPLSHCQIKFEDLPGPSYTIKRVLDGNVVARDNLDAELEALASSTFVNWKNEADVSAALLTGKPARGAAFAFNIVMRSASDHISKMPPATVISPFLSFDGATHVAGTNAVPSVGLGQFRVSLTDTEMNFREIACVFQAPGADDLDLIIETAG